VGIISTSTVSTLNSTRQIHYHIVFPVKYRRGLLDEAVVKIIMLTAKEIEEIEERYDIEFEQIGCDKDHVHRGCPRFCANGI